VVCAGGGGEDRTTRRHYTHSQLHARAHAHAHARGRDRDRQARSRCRRCTHPGLPMLNMSARAGGMPLRCHHSRDARDAHRPALRIEGFSGPMSCTAPSILVFVCATRDIKEMCLLWLQPRPISHPFARQACSTSLFGWTYTPWPCARASRSPNRRSFSDP